MPIITISRQLGSHGDVIARAVARALDIPYLDKELVRLAAAELGISEATAFDLERQRAWLDRLVALFILGDGPAGIAGDQAPLPPPATAMSAVYQQVMENVIHQIGARGQGVVVGRGGQLLLRETPAALHVSIRAPLPVRVQRVAREFGLSTTAATAAVETSDRDRADFLRARFGVDWQAPDLYDLVICTGKLMAEAAAASIVAAVSALAPAPAAADRRLRQSQYAVAEAAELVRLSPEVIRHAVYAGDLPALRSGKAITAIRRQDLLAWLKRELTGVSASPR